MGLLRQPELAERQVRVREMQLMQTQPSDIGLEPHFLAELAIKEAQRLPPGPDFHLDPDTDMLRRIGCIVVPAAGPVHQQAWDTITAQLENGQLRFNPAGLA